MARSSLVRTGARKRYHTKHSHICRLPADGVTATITDSIFLSNTAQTGGALEVTHGAKVTAKKNRFAANTVAGAAGTIVGESVVAVGRACLAAQHQELPDTQMFCIGRRQRQARCPLAYRNDSGNSKVRGVLLPSSALSPKFTQPDNSFTTTDHSGNVLLDAPVADDCLQIGASKATLNGNKQVKCRQV